MLSPDTYEQIVLMHLKGFNQEQIARKLGCGKATVYRYIKKYKNERRGIKNDN